MKTSELTGDALDWAVVRANYEINFEEVWLNWREDCRYSTDWAEAGPIIERARIGVEPWGGDAFWVAMTYSETGMTLQKKFGSKPLIAAMRCYVASRLGDDVEIPEELT